MSITENLNKIYASLPPETKLVAVSKTKPIEMIQEAYDAGQRLFGENKIQELQSKQPALPKDIEWHMIGHLQTNKVKYIAPFISLIHAVDSLKLLKAIEKEALKNKRIIPVLLQIHIAEEKNKFGFSIEALDALLASEEHLSCNHVHIAGLMGMASFTQDQNQLKHEFELLSTYFGQLKEKYFADQDTFKEISMGMSNDYLLAAQAGSTMVRVGSSIFGLRNQQGE